MSVIVNFIKNVGEGFNLNKNKAMYRNAYQRGMLTILFSGGANPLNIWDVRTQDGYVSRFLDQEIKGMVIDIGGTNVSTTYITCPKGNVVLGITMPFLVMIVKNLKKYFSFEVTILDETLTRRRFRVSNFQSTTQILPLCTAMPIGLSDGWNQIQFNLAEFTRRAYKKQFVEVQKLKINANIRIRRIYFAERLLPEDQLPPEYKLYFPLPTKGLKDKKTLARETADKENILTSQQESKPAEGVQIEEKDKSEIKVLKSSSKTSVHSIKKVPSHASRKSTKVISEPIPEGQMATPEEAPENTGEDHEKNEQAAEKTSDAVNIQTPEETADTHDTMDATETPGDVTGVEAPPVSETEPAIPEEVQQTET